MILERALIRELCNTVQCNCNCDPERKRERREEKRAKQDVGERERRKIGCPSMRGSNNNNNGVARKSTIIE